MALGIGIFLAAGLAVVVGRTQRFQKWYTPPVLALPSDDEVAEIRASLWKFQGVFPAVPEFTVPAAHVSNILRWLRPAEYLRETWDPISGDELGQVVIRTTDGREMELVFYWTGKNGVIFTPNGEDQYYGRGTDSEGHYIDGGMCLRYSIEDASKALR